ncbi:polygalacturonase [Stereum hirsutum FP-91666 SS1]|uniref:polygalacturonase n=1 Tax=Stereum hirsutum (strain FP-91666) TaxID=721885 RepID=UPI00044493EC|nr:polygalacturonase [Stereum hirsutum FP-91666 SS1]EIM85583.1 polygalacturonase [Stereum hirsutum FP-91666 SS1]
MQFLCAFIIVALAGVASAVPASDAAKRATCTVDSVSSASSVSSCSTVTIKAFTVPSGNTVTIAAKKGATINMEGDITFSKTTSDGPLFTLDTDSVTFNGNGYKVNGNGAAYWDGEGTNGGVDKPHPFVKVKGYGTFNQLYVLNSPAQAVSVGTSGTTVINKATVDNSAGDSGDKGHNTDGFDVSASDVTIQYSVVKNQDDCIAINSGSNIVFKGNTCSGGHGISIGSISDAKTVSGVTISDNTVTASMYGIRIKVKAYVTATGSVSDVTYSGNTLSGIDKYGVLISQSYPDDAGTPGTKSSISDVNFTGSTTSVSVGSSGKRLVVDCGNCSGNWDFSKLSITGGKSSSVDADDATVRLCPFSSDSHRSES